MKDTRDKIILRREYLRNWHKEKNITFTYVADYLDISLRYYMRILDGVRGTNLSARIMYCLCNALNVAGDELIEEEALFQENLIILKHQNIR